MRIALFVVSLPLIACGKDAAKTPDAPPPPPADAAPDADPDALTAQELAAIAQLSPLPAVPADTTNAYADNAAAAALGQMLFFDKSYAGALAVGDGTDPSALGMVGETGKVACASCHTAGSTQLDDQRSMPNNVSLGADYGPRNALGIVNSAYYTWTNWGGKFDSQWSLPLGVAENPKLVNSTRLSIAHLLWTKYRAEYNAIFPVPLDPSLDPNAADASRFPASGKPGQPAFDGMAAADQAIANTIFVNYGKAIAAYTRKIVSGSSRFDRFVAGDRNALNSSEIRGLKLFLAKGCADCHSGPTFSDNKFHALAVSQTGLHVPTSDLGRYTDVASLLTSPFTTSGAFSDDTTTGKLTGVAQDASQKGQFRTRGLRNVSQSGPFMHDGSLATLDDVIAFYDAGGGDPGSSGIVKDALLTPLGLAAQDRTDLVAFLGTLTGDPVAAALLADTSK
jgi:cytochrome c peroxidase